MSKFVRLTLSLAILSTLMILPALPGNAVDEPELPACPIVDGIVLEHGVDWGPLFLRADRNEEDAEFGPVPIDLEPGYYSVTLASFDVRSAKTDLQENERWLVEVFNGGISEFTSPAISDLPDNEALLVENVASKVWLEGDSVAVKHAAFKDPDDNPQSVFALCAAFERVGSFIDDGDSVFESDIEWMFAQGITKGCNPPANDNYCPDNYVTRGQMAAFLTRALGLTDQADNPFTDDDGSVFENDIEKLAAAGITRGCNPPANDNYCPDNYVTRGQMAAFLRRGAAYLP